MAGTLFGFPFNEELFSYNWKNAPDPVGTALVNSGAVVVNGEIATQISQGSNIYTVPFYNVIGGEEQNYDGATDIVPTETDGGYQSGIVYGRAKAWTARDFVGDYHKADPMAAIASQVQTYWSKQRQARIIGILTAIFGVTAGTDQYSKDWASNHSTTLTTALDETSINDACVKACGDLATGNFGLAIMHSTVAKNLANKELLEYRKYTDPSGIQRQLNIADINGLTVVISDQVPSTAKTYTTYVLGNGAIQFAQATVQHPVEADRNPYKNGGEEVLITRLRETLLPNGFTYTAETADGQSPTNTELFKSAKYKPIFDPKCIAMAQIVSAG
jgi:hypothetical protein